MILVYHLKDVEHLKGVEHQHHFLLKAAHRELHKNGRLVSGEEQSTRVSSDLHKIPDKAVLWVFKMGAN